MQAASIRIPRVRAGRRTHLRLQNIPPENPDKVPSSRFKLAANASATPPSTEVYSAHDHTARFQASDPLPLLSWARRWRAATQPVSLREGMRGTGDCGAICAGRPAAKGGGREGLASQRPHRRRRLRRPVPGPGRISLSTPAPRFRTSAPAAKARPPQTRLRPVELPGPKSFHPRSCSQAGVGANPAQA